MRTRKRPVRVAVSDGAKPWVAVGEFLKAVPRFMAERKVCWCGVFPRPAKQKLAGLCRCFRVSGREAREAREAGEVAVSTSHPIILVLFVGQDPLKAFRCLRHGEG